MSRSLDVEMETVESKKFVRTAEVPKWLWDPGLCICLLAATAALLIYYISGPALAALHSDCTDSLLWAQATVESGKILTEDFTYSALLPFGSPLWMVPILHIFGYGVTAYVLSMVVFALIFIAAAYWLLRSLKWNRPCAAAGVFCICMLLSGSAKLLEIMWGHVIYYSLGLVLWMLLVSFAVQLVNCLKGWKRKEKLPKGTVIRAIGLFLLCVGCATDGFQVLSISVVPVIAALIAQVVFEKKSMAGLGAVKKYGVAALMVLGTGVGLILLLVITNFGSINAPYENGYSKWDVLTDWVANVQQILPHFLSLFGIDIAGGEPLFSADSLLDMAKVFCALAVFVCPFVLLIRYGKIRHEASRLVLWAHLSVTAIIFFAYICGKLNTAAWRLTPFLGTSIIATLVLLWELFCSGVVEKRVSVILAALLMMISVTHGTQILSLPNDIESNDYWQIAQTLEEKGYDYGYATFWNSHTVTLLSDNQVKAVSVKADDGEIRPYYYQNMDGSFDDQPNQDTYFLLLDQTEYGQVLESEYWIRLNQTRSIVDEFTCQGYIILVFDGNPIV